ncbi:hypothetical protein F5B21DRAFT_452154, partial [Xylaria acuta]
MVYADRNQLHHLHHLRRILAPLPGIHLYILLTIVVSAQSALGQSSLVLSFFCRERDSTPFHFGAASHWRSTETPLLSWRTKPYLVFHFAHPAAISLVPFFPWSALQCCAILGIPSHTHSPSL